MTAHLSDTLINGWPAGSQVCDQVIVDLREDEINELLQRMGSLGGWIVRNCVIQMTVRQFTDHRDDILF